MENDANSIKRREYHIVILNIAVLYLKLRNKINETKFVLISILMGWSSITISKIQFNGPLSSTRSVLSP